MRKIIGEFSETGYIVKDADTGEELYRADTTDNKGNSSDIESIEIWCEQTGREMAKSMEEATSDFVEFLGVIKKDGKN